MTQQVYRLELTEQERDDSIFAYENEAVRFAQLKMPGADKIAKAYRDLAERLRALEPVGTEGGS